MRWRTRALCGTLMAAVAIAVAGGCAGNSPIDISPPGSPTPPTLSGGVMAAFADATCSSGACHGNATRSAGNGYFSLTASTAYAALVQTTGMDHMIVVNKTNATMSEVLLKPDMNDTALTHTGQKLWSSTPGGTKYNDYQAVLLWIQAGAQNN